MEIIGQEYAEVIVMPYEDPAVPRWGPRRHLMKEVMAKYLVESFAVQSRVHVLQYVAPEQHEHDIYLSVKDSIRVAEALYRQVRSAIASIRQREASRSKL